MFIIAYSLLQCKRWDSLKTFLGCDDSLPMRDLCSDITIDSMFTLKDRVYIFRKDKYWEFKYNQQNSDQPLGQLIEGSIEIHNKWKGYTPDDRFTVHDNQIVAVSGQKWIEMKPNGQISKTEDISTENFETPSDSQVSK